MNTNKYSKVGIMLIIGLLTSCSANIKSVKNPEFNQKVTRIVFTMENKSLAKEPEFFFMSFSDAFTAELKSSSVEAVRWEKAQLQEAISKHNPDVVISIIQTKTMGHINGSIGYVESGAKFEVRMFIPSNPDVPVWTAKVKVMGNLMAAYKAAAKKMASNFIEKLGEDGIITVVQSK